MFAAWIAEVRTRLSSFGWRWTQLGRRRRPLATVFARDCVSEAMIAEHVRLSEHGLVVWAAIAQANDAAFEAGDLDVPANIVFGVDPYFDAHPHHLVRIARRVFDRKGTFPEEPVEAKVAAIITDEANGVTNRRLPFSITDGHVVYLSSLMLLRKRLPGRVLRSSVLPVVGQPAESCACMLAPLPCWPADVRRHPDAIDAAIGRAGPLDERPVSQDQLAKDEADARAHPHRPLRADDVVPGASRATLTLTPMSVRQLHATARASDIAAPWYVKVGGDGDRRSLDLVQGMPESDTERVTCDGITVAIPRRLLRHVRGCVLDYRETWAGATFMFVEP